MSARDPSELNFARTDIRPSRRSPWSMSAVGVVLTLLGMVAAILLVRVLVEPVSATVSPPPGASVPPSAEIRARRDAQMEVMRQRQLASLKARRAASSSVVYRCVSRDGAVSLQSQPCDPSQQVTRVVPAPPDRRREPPIQLYRLPPGDRQAAVIYGAPETERDRRRRNCAAAKATREQTLNAVGIARTYDLLQRLDAQVYEACKGL